MLTEMHSEGPDKPILSWDIPRLIKHWDIGYIKGWIYRILVLSCDGSHNVIFHHPVSLRHHFKL
jgi:hypothetical protein